LPQLACVLYFLIFFIFSFFYIPTGLAAISLPTAKLLLLQPPLLLFLRQSLQFGLFLHQEARLEA
jgi:hypothetical protein